MLILILINVQYSQKAVFRFEKGSEYENQPSSGSHHSHQKLRFPLPPPPPNTYTHTLYKLHILKELYFLLKNAIVKLALL